MTIAKMKNEYKNVLHEAKMMAFLQIVHRYPKATIADLAAFAKHCGLHKVEASVLTGELPRTPEEWMQKFSEHKALPAPRRKPVKTKLTRKRLSTAAPKGKPKAAKKKHAKRKTKKSLHSKVVLNTEAAKEKFDASIVEFLSGQNEWTGADVVRTAVGGTPLQVRTAINRLWEDGRIKYTGHSRGMKYKAA